MRFHAQRQGFKTLERNPCIERTHGWPGGSDRGINFFTHALFISDHGTTDDPALPIEILGRRMHDQISTQLQRFLQRWGTKTVIDYQQAAMFMSQVRQLGDIGYFSQRIGWRLDKQ